GRGCDCLATTLLVLRSSELAVCAVCDLETLFFQTMRVLTEIRRNRIRAIAAINKKWPARSAGRDDIRWVRRPEIRSPRPREQTCEAWLWVWSWRLSGPRLR